MVDCANHRCTTSILGLVLILTNVTAQERGRHVPVFGIVRDVSGKPVPDAEVRVVRYKVEGLPSYQADQLDIPLVESNATRTDARGRFVLRLDGADHFGVVATLGKELRSPVVAPVAPGAQVEVVLRRCVTIRGRVVDMLAGKASPGVGVSVRCYVPGHSAVSVRPWPDTLMGRLDTVQTGAQGEFAIRGLTGARCLVECDGERIEIEMAVDAAEREPVVLTRKVFRARGTVVDATTKKPIAQARLFAGRGRFRADAEGKFDVLVPGNFQFDVTAPGYRLLRHRFQDGEPGAVALAEAARVRMRIVDDEARPCPRHDLCVLQLSSGDTGSGPALTTHTTGLDGTLQLPAGPDGHGFIVWARVENRWLRVCDAPPTEENLDLGDVSIATYDLQGTVVDAQGLPAANVPLFAAPTEPAFGSRLPLAQHPVAYTDHAGRFRISGLPRRPFELAARSPDSLATFGPVVRGPTKAALRLQLQPAQRIQGRVVDDAGKPVAGAIVSATAFRVAGERLRRFGLWSNSARSDASGSFSVAVVVKDAPHQVSVQKIGRRGQSRQDSIEPGASDVVLTLSRSK